MWEAMLEKVKQEIADTPEDNRTYYDISYHRYLGALNLLGSIPPGKVLDLGCSPGHMAMAMAFADFDVTGLDLHSGYAEKYLKSEWKEKLKIQLVDLEKDNLPFDENQFDYVIFCEVLEHIGIRQPVEVLNEVYRVLAPGGIFILSTPNVANVSNALALWQGSNIFWREEMFYGSLERHNREFTLTEMRDLMTRTPFESVEYRTSVCDSNWNSDTSELIYHLFALLKDREHVMPDHLKSSLVASKKYVELFLEKEGLARFVPTLAFFNNTILVRAMKEPEKNMKRGGLMTQWRAEREDVEETLGRLREEFEKEKKIRADGSVQLSWYPENEIQLDDEELRPEEIKLNETAVLNGLLESLVQNQDARIGGDLFSTRPVIGGLVVFIKRVVRRILRPYANMILTRQTEFNRNLVHALNIVVERARKNESDFKGALNAINGRIDGIAEWLSGMAKQIDGMGEYINAIGDSLSVTNDQLDDLRNTHNKLLKGTISNLRTINRKLRQDLPRLDSLFYEGIAFKDNFEKLMEKLEAGSPSAPQDIGADILKQGQLINDSSYYLFEGYHRGETESIAEKQADYIDYFKGKNNILDVGCGRGEFLAYLHARGIEVCGVDSNQVMVESCREKGLNVECDDFVNYLSRAEDETFGGIFSSQVIEHLSEKQILQFISLARRKLQPSGVIVLETLNPLSLVSFSDFFYKDMSHKTPVHPDTLSFLLTSNGFKNVHVIFISPADKEKHLKIVEKSDISECSPENVEIMNENIDKLNTVLFGFQEYFVVAEK